MKLRSLIAFLVVAGAAGLGALVSGPALAQDNEPRISIDAERMSIKAFLQILSDKAGLTFLDEAGVEGEITGIGRQLTRESALELLRTWLGQRSKGIVVTGNIVRIMTLENIKKNGGIRVIVGNDPEKVPETDEVVTQVIPLRRVKAGDIRNEFRTLLSQDGQMYIEPTSNSLVVTDTNHVIRRMLKILDPIDKSPQLELQVKPFHLKNANCEEVAQMIKEIFPKRIQGQPGQGGNNPQQMIRQFFGGGGGGGGGRGNQPGAGAETSDVNVSIDKRSNTVIVAATKGQLDLLTPLIEELDTTPVAVIEDLRSFPLKNANPVDMAAILQDIFQKPTTAQPQQGGGGQQFRQFVQAMQGQPPGAAGDGPTRYLPDPKFTVDARTNSLIVSAVPSQMRVIEKLIVDLDNDATFRQSILVVPLRNADATNVAKVLTDLLNAANANRQPNQNQANVRGGLTNSLAELSGDVKVVADTDSNALVVTTSPKNFSRVRQIIQDLDRVRKQVLIETLIAEVTLDDKSSLGVQWQTNWIRGIDGQVGGTSNAGTFGGLGALTQGFQYLSTSNKLSLTIQALQTDGKLNVLSSPKILAMENQTAQISVGQDVPYVTNSRITQNGDTVNTIQYKNVGVILKVTPHINEHGEVRMVVHPEVSEIGPASEAVPISTGVTSPVFNDNFADTTIVVQDGETAILGGLIRNELTDNVQKLPILGDIPIVGLIFRTRTVEKKKVELIVLMTPHVVDDAEQLRRRTRQTEGKYVLVGPETLQDELERWTRGLEDGSAVKAYNRGTVYLEANRIGLAVEELEKARDLAPEDAATHFNLGLAYARKGDVDKAIVELNEAQRLDARDPETHYNLGALLWRRLDYNGAAREFRACLHLDPNHDEAKRWLDRAEKALKDVPQGDPK